MKQMLVYVIQNPAIDCIVKMSRSVVFYSVPHKGSHLAAYLSQTKSLLYPSVEVQELNYGCEKLQELHTKFKNIINNDRTPVISFCEDPCTERY